MRGAGRVCRRGGADGCADACFWTACSGCAGAGPGPGLRGSPLGGLPRDRLRGVANAGKRLWILCVGWGRLVYERDHPRAPNEAMPLDEVVEIADSCFNPLGFLGIG